MLLILLHIICFTKILRILLYSKHKKSYMFLKYIKRVKHLTILFKYVSRESLDFVTLDTMADQL